MSTAVPDLSGRRAPRFGGFNPTVLKLEVRRLLRNTGSIIITVVIPVIFFFVIGLNSHHTSIRYGHANYTAYVMISLSLYGAVFSTTYGGAAVSIERSAGWRGQLRLTPLSAAAYISMKVLTALILGGTSVLVVNVVALLTGKASMPGNLWIVSALCVWIGSLLFVAFGLFLGYLLPTENVTQIVGLIMTLLGFAGGLFIPLSLFPDRVQAIAKWTPEYGLNQLVHAPVLGQGVEWTWVVNVVAWLVIFGGGAIWLFRRDTRRV